MKLFLLILFSSFIIPPLHAACNAGDEKALLALRNGDESRRGILPDWGRPGSSCCSWRGITCQSDRVISISLPSLGLWGQLPPELENLSQLKTLNLFQNSFSGPLPPEPGKLLQLEVLNLASNHFTGSIPSSYSNLSKLKQLDLSTGDINGRIPNQLGNLVSLQKLTITGTRLTGRIPGTFGNLRQLKSLDLSRNFLMSGAIPESLGQLRLLEELNLRRSGLTGKIPESLGGLTSLVNLELGENSLTGPLPESLGLHTNLKHLSAYSNKLSGRVPEGWSKGLTSLTMLLLSHNSITGLPSSMANLRNLQVVSLDSNAGLTFDAISGLGTLPQLSSVSLSGCGLKGPIPGWMRSMKLKPGSESPMQIDLSDNQITGDIPSEFGKLAELQLLALQSNKLSGRVPDSIGDLRKLVFFNAGSNLLTGIPADLRNMGVGTLYRLGLSNNNLTSFNELKGLTTLSRVVSLDLSSCRLKGPTPDWFSSIRIVAEENFAALELHSNEISGVIPASLARLSELTQLDLHDNQMSGQIPAGLSAIGKLRSLDLSSNRLSGGIPAEILKLNQLEYFNVSSNQLRGEIPAGPPLNAMEPSNFANNPGLCGAPLPPCK